MSKCLYSPLGITIRTTKGFEWKERWFSFHSNQQMNWASVLPPATKWQRSAPMQYVGVWILPPWSSWEEESIDLPNTRNHKSSQRIRLYLWVGHITYVIRHWKNQSILQRKYNLATCAQDVCYQFIILEADAMPTEWKGRIVLNYLLQDLTKKHLFAAEVSRRRFDFLQALM